MLYMIWLLDPIVQNDYNVIYFHTHVKRASGRFSRL